jgi:hypothetical protein
VLSDGGFSTYNALKNSLTAQAGTAGLMRRDTSSGRDNDDDEEDSEAAAEQLTLDDLVGA